MWLVIDRTFLPHCGQIRHIQTNLEVLREPSVALEAKNEQVLIELAEISTLIRELATVKVEHFKQARIDNLLFFG